MAVNNGTTTGKELREQITAIASKAFQERNPELSAEVYSEVEKVIRDATHRVATGDAQKEYGGLEQVQRFETMDLDDLLEYAEQESLDSINYHIMAVLRFRALRRALQKSISALANSGYQLRMVAKDAERESAGNK